MVSSSPPPFSSFSSAFHFSTILTLSQVKVLAVLYDGGQHAKDVSISSPLPLFLLRLRRNTRYQRVVVAACRSPHAPRQPPPRADLKRGEEAIQRRVPNHRPTRRGGCRPVACLLFFPWLPWLGFCRVQVQCNSDAPLTRNLNLTTLSLAISWRAFD